MRSKWTTAHPAVLNVCSQFDDFAVCWSLQREFCQSWRGGGVGSLSRVIYEKPQSICVINFVNERQNDVVLGSFNVSQHYVFHGTGSESGTPFFFLLCPWCFVFWGGDKCGSVGVGLMDCYCESWLCQYGVKGCHGECELMLPSHLTTFQTIFKVPGKFSKVRIKWARSRDLGRLAQGRFKSRLKLFLLVLASWQYQAHLILSQVFSSVLRKLCCSVTSASPASTESTQQEAAN